MFQYIACFPAFSSSCFSIPESNEINGKIDTKWVNYVMSSDKQKLCDMIRFRKYQP